ncbi:MAG: 5-methylcytosine-specific restriction endonuclease system specificity protein McrC [Lachnospiraceae bacterium]|nr:5-methylcytosine-specific restriction endonuclease system specificity protein McrC [Butyrivibrio sp.]MCM1343058.1 5-methylcytosine-specific restriction endonuclease system specificity protein McrC [Muribaculaceae bacterium]MCM1410379.1 5-methylcytosine-specific restriction endonuclease system specificity protein McrC [Lachnospiraceae bacterium]
MTKDKSILIKNIYYMLSYAFQILKQSNYDEVASEKFDKAQDLFAAILSKGIAQQLKQGLFREYVTRNETLSVLRGKLDMPNTIRNRIQRKQKLACEFDELSENNLFNQILKTTIHFLIIDDGVDPERKSALKKLLVFLDGIQQLEPSEIPWSRLHYRRNNKNYELLMNICYFVLDGMLQTTEEGEYRMAAFSDDHMARLYEKFILEYYHQHHTYLSEVKAGQIKWDLVGDNSESMIRFLPVMRTDIMLRLNERILIIDAKYYGQTLQTRFDKHSLHSGNVYQIFAYVKNQDKDNTGNVAGLLLYAKTDEEITPDCTFNMGGNQIGAKTLDLNKEFPLIAAQLDKIADDFFDRTQLPKASDGKNEMAQIAGSRRQP